jgi:hypothetical protein
MSKEIKLALLALVVLPVFAVWLFWGRPASDATDDRRPAGPAELLDDTARAALVAPAPSVVAPAASESANAVLEPPAPSSSTPFRGEASARLLLRHRPTFLKGAPRGCDPPYTIDSEGNRLYKKECF